MTVPYTRPVSVTPALVLAALVGGFHTVLYVFLTGRIGLRTILTLAAAVLGAWAGDAVAAMLGIDPVRLGDFRLLAASAVAWAGIGFVEALLDSWAVGPTRAPMMARILSRGRGTQPGVEVRRTGSASAGLRPRSGRRGARRRRDRGFEDVAATAGRRPAESEVRRPLRKTPFCRRTAISDAAASAASRHGVRLPRPRGRAATAGRRPCRGLTARSRAPSGQGQSPWPGRWPGPRCPRPGRGRSGRCPLHRPWPLQPRPRSRR